MGIHNARRQGNRQHRRASTSVSSDRLRRDQIAAAVIKSIATRNLGTTLLMRDADGAAPVVVALEHELLSELIGRVMAAGGAANAFISMDDGRLLRASMNDANGRPQLVEAGETFGREQVHNDIEVGMFASWALEHETGVSFSISLPSSSASVAHVRDVDLVA